MGTILFLSGQHIFLVMIVVLLLFGADKMPEVAKGLAKGMQDLKKATDDIKKEFEASTKEIRNNVSDIQSSIRKDASDFSENIRKNANDISDSFKDEINSSDPSAGSTRSITEKKENNPDNLSAKSTGPIENSQTGYAG